MNADTRYEDGWIRAADDRMERGEWTILKTHDSAGGPLHLLFKGHTRKGGTECVGLHKTAREAMDDVAYREERSAAMLCDVDSLEAKE
ncbi:MAG: hypothetical protein ABL964_09810 [Steroidobacteraceae bacterium]